MKRLFLHGLLFVWIFGVCTHGVARPPNFVVIFTDDLGYGDLGVQGHPSLRTPNLDRMAAEGARFTDFYSAAPVCTPSRAALLTGRYPLRSGMCQMGSSRSVLFPNSPGGLPPGEVTVAELLREAGYATAHVGKWHLGIHPGSRPQDQGFDQTFGLPYSNDMDAVPGLTKGAAMSPQPPADGWNVPLLRNGTVVEQPADQTLLTRRYTDESLAFIRAHKERPFFLYLAHSMPHVPLFASPRFKGRSARGLYGDTVEEIDASTGEILAALRAEGLAENTLVIFTSDNGPWLTQGSQGGSAGLLREGKGSTWEGGMRVPCIAWMPGTLQPSVISEPVSALDIFPTLAAIAEIALPKGVELDGRNVAPVVLEGASMPDRPFFYYRGDEIYACRVGPWKLHVRTRDGYGGSAAEVHNPGLLYHLPNDPSERHDRAANHPEVVARLRGLIAAQQASVRPGPPQLQ
ncbi:MAG: sulfatase [Opitutaceae bacterium]|nr:sulfatase [Opitutaceae bacterium]